MDVEKEIQLNDGWWIPKHRPELHAKWRHPVRAQMAKDIGVIERTLKHVKGRECAVQAGARVGLWPKILAGHFKAVYTFEPEHRNYACAERNLEQCENVSLYQAALGAKQGVAIVEVSNDTDGSHQIVKDHLPNKVTQSTPVVAIDSFNINPDVMFLDIEGFELFAIQGAYSTIKRCRPVIVAEHNSAMKRYGLNPHQIKEYLAPFGYTVVDRHYKDWIFVPR